MRKILSMILAFVMCAALFSTVVMADEASAVFVSAGDITSSGITLRFTKNLSNDQAIKINGTEISATGDNGTYKIKQSFELDKPYNITLDDENVYSFVLKKLYSDNAETTLKNSTDTKYIEINDSSYVVETTIKKVNGDVNKSARLEVFKYTNGNTVTDAQRYIVRDYYNNYFAFVCAANTPALSADNGNKHLKKESYDGQNVAKDFNDGIVGIWTGSAAPWASADVKYTFYEKSGTNYILKDGEQLLSGSFANLIKRTSGGVILRAQNDNNPVTISGVTVYKAIEIKKLDVKNVYATSSGLTFVADSEPAIAPQVKINGDDIGREFIVVNGNDININYDFESGKAYKINVKYNDTDIYNKTVVRNLKFNDSCSGGTNVSDLWSVEGRYKSGNAWKSFDNTSSMVKYESSKLVIDNPYKYDDATYAYSELIIAPKVFDASHRNQTVEYTINVANKNYDYLSLMLSATKYYNNTDKSNYLIKYANDKVKARHTLNNTSDYNISDTAAVLSSNTDRKVVQSLCNKSIRISVDGKSVIDTVDNNITEEGLFAFRFAAGSEVCKISLSDIKVYDIVELTGIQIFGFEYKNGVAKAQLVNYSSDSATKTGAVLAFYNEGRTQLLGAAVAEVNGAEISFSNLTKPSDAKYAALYIWKGELEPVCAESMITFE